MSYDVRGRVARSRFKVQIPLRSGNVLTAEGLKPLLLCYVRTGDSNARREWRRACELLGITARPVQALTLDHNEELTATDLPEGDFADWPKPYPYQTAFECVGTSFALAQLKNLGCVASWENVMGTSIPRGMGTEVPKRSAAPRPVRPFVSEREEQRRALVKDLTRDDAAAGIARRAVMAEWSMIVSSLFPPLFFRQITPTAVLCGGTVADMERKPHHMTFPY